MANISTCFLWPEVTEMFNMLLGIRDEVPDLPVDYDFQDEFTSNNPIVTTEEFPRASTPTPRERDFGEEDDPTYERFSEGLKQVHSKLKVRGYKPEKSFIVNGYLVRKSPSYRVYFCDDSLEQMFRDIMSGLDDEYPFHDSKGIWPEDLSSTIFESLPDSLFSPGVSSGQRHNNANEMSSDFDAMTSGRANLAFINSTICELSTHEDPVLDAEFPLLSSCVQKCQRQRRRVRHKIPAYRKNRNQETFVWQIMPSKNSGLVITPDIRRRSLPRNLRC